jgi:recombinational DNA repair protein RecR
VLVQAREWTRKRNWRLELGEGDIFVAGANTCREALSLSKGARGARRTTSGVVCLNCEAQSRRPALVRSVRDVYWLHLNRLWSSTYHILPETFSGARARSSEKLTLLCS